MFSYCYWKKFLMVLKARDAFYGLSFFESVGWKVWIPIRNHVFLITIELDEAFNKDGRQITLIPREAVQLRLSFGLQSWHPLFYHQTCIQRRCGELQPAASDSASRR